MFGLKQKLAIGFGGLLLTLLLVGGLGVVVLIRYTGTLDQFLRENGRSVEYGQRVTDAVDRLDELTAANRLTPAAAAGPLHDADQAVDDENHNITLEGESAIAAALTSAWSTGYRPVIVRMTDPAVGAAARPAALAEVRLRSQKVRDAARAVVDLNLANMRPLQGHAKEMADAAVRWMVIGGITGTALAVLLTALVSRSVLRPLSTVIRSIREIEQGNLDLVVTVKSRDELRQLAEAVNSMAAKLREFRRTNRAKLIRTQQTTQLAVDSLPDAVAVTAPDGTIELSNEAARKLFGLTTGLALAAVGDRRLKDVYDEVIRTAMPSKPRGYESAVEVYDAGGQLRFFLPHAVPIGDGESKPVGVTLVLADVTNLRRLDEMKSGLLSVVSHELKTPLTSIRMALHLLLEERIGPLNPKQAELATAAREDSDRLDKIIAGLLDMGRLESGRDQLELRPESPRRLIDEAVAPLLAGFHDKEIAVDIEVPQEIADVLVDPARIGHVFTNLLTNAMKFTDAGGRVTVSVRGEGSDRNRFEVADTGVGIPAEYLPRVFDRFFRVPGSVTGTPGAGLGLAIAREIVQVHGGQIDVRSTPGEGTRFGFTLRTGPQSNS
jgi:NtrC-family two-component system sensor histidine kinase KinB